MKRRRAAGCAAALAMLAAACSSQAEAAGVLRAREVSGEVEVRGAAGTWEPLRPGRSLEAGEEVRTASDGGATLSSAAGSFELAPSAWIVVRSAAHVVARTGRVLASAQRRGRLDDESGLVVAARGATFRLDVGTRVAVYRGTARVSLPTGAVDVAVGRAVTLGLVSPDVRALAIDPNDPWDVRLLADAIQIDRALRPYQRTFEANTATQPRSLEFFGRYVQPDAIAFLAPLLGTRLAAYGKLDVLIALYMAIERSDARGSGLQAAFLEVASLREEGATFGLAAQILGVRPEALLQRLVAGLTPGAPPQRVRDPRGRPGPQPSRTPGPGGPPNGSPRPSPSPSPSTSPSPTASPSCAVVEQILGRCGSPTPTPTV